MAISQALRFTSRRFEEARQVLRCSYNYKRGATVCPNRVQIRQDLLDHAVLKAIDDVLDQRIVRSGRRAGAGATPDGPGTAPRAEDLKTKLAAEQDRKGILRPSWTA